jgi:hypothetical protein
MHRAKHRTKLFSPAISSEIFQRCQRKGRLEPRGIYVRFLLAFSPILAKDYYSLFHSIVHITYSILMLLSWSLSRQHTLLNKMTGWWPIPENIAYIRLIYLHYVVSDRQTDRQTNANTELILQQNVMANWNYVLVRLIFYQLLSLISHIVSSWSSEISKFYLVFMLLFYCNYKVCSESRCALRLRYVDLIASMEVVVAVCCYFTAFSC